MASYKDPKSILEVVLGKYKDQGFSLIQASKNILELYHGDHMVSVYNFYTVTVEDIRKSCSNYLKSLTRSKR